MKKQSRRLLSFILAAVICVTALVICVVASDTAPALEINGANVSFEGTVHLWYSVGYKNIDTPNGIKLLIWRESSVDNIKNCTYGTEDTVLTPNGDVNDGKVVGKTFDYDELAAAEMTENVYARAYINVDGEAVYSPVVKYSILQYSLNKLGITGTASDNAALKAMLREMLEYGAAAQTFFDPDSDAPLATDSFVKVKAVGATFADGTTTSLVRLGEKVKLYATPTEELPYVIWTKADGKQVGSGDSYNLKATANMTYTATLSSIASSFGAYDHVVLVGIDGAGGSLFEAADMANCDTIFANGAVTYDMITKPSVSAHSWASILHGVEVEDHGVMSNTQVETGAAFASDSKFPSILRVLREADDTNKVASIASWGGINVGIVEDGFGIYKYKNGDLNGTAEAVNYINENNDLEFLYVHFNDPDAAGHGYGYGGTEYNEKMKRTDGYINEIYQALVDNGMAENTLFIVTTDHGGVDKGHGGLTDAETHVFFGAVGKTVAKDSTIVDMENRDCAAVVLYALGYEQPETYTARVPAGLFDGVKAAERPTYYDKDNPRDIPASGTTPAKGSDAYITKYTDKPLYVYMPFDGNSDDKFGNVTTEIGTVKYQDGYYGGAVSLDEGSVELASFFPGMDSFTVSMMIKAPAAYRKSPLITNKQWNEANGKNRGFLLAFDGDASPNTAILNVGDDTNQHNLVVPLPEDYNRGWMNVLFVVDRENNELRLCFDFGEVYTLELPESFRTALLNSSQYDLAIGNDTQSGSPHKMGLTVDELMFFRGAFDTNDINGMAEYFGKTPVHGTVEETPNDRDHENVDTPTVGSGNHLSDYDEELFSKLDYYFPFDMSTVNAADSNKTATEVGTITYATQGYFGEALKLRTQTSSIKLPDIAYGKNSFSVSFWINTGNATGSTIPILSTQDIKTSSKSKGFTLFMNAGAKNVSFYLADGSTRYTQSVAFPEDYKDGWTHVIFIMDRESKQWKLSYDFGELVTGSLAANNYTADGLDGSVWTIGQDGFGGYWTALTPMIDEFMIFNGTLNSRQINTLAKYYGKPVAGSMTAGEYIDANAPDFDKDIMLDLDFDNEIYNAGSQSTGITTGSMVYVDSPFGSAADFSGAGGVSNSEILPENYLHLDDFKLSSSVSGGGYNSVSFSFWLKLGEEAPTTSDRIIVATTDVGSSDLVPGMAIVLYGKAVKVTESMLPTNANLEDYTFDEDGYAMYASTGKYVYRQLLQIRATSSTLDPSSTNGAYYYDRQSLYIFSSLDEWSHFAVVFDRGEYGVDDGEYRVYQNGVSLSGVDKWNTLKMNNVVEDQADLNGEGLKINDDVNHYPRAMESQLDELLVFDGALTAEDVALLLEYYESIRDAE